MPAPHDAVSKAFTAVVQRRYKSGAQAAKALDVSRESFNKYKRGLRAPNRHALARAIELWGPIMAEFGFDQRTGESSAAIPQAIQLSLFSEGFLGEHVTVQVESKSTSRVELAVTIKVA